MAPIFLLVRIQKIPCFLSWANPYDFKYQSPVDGRIKKTGFWLSISCKACLAITKVFFFFYKRKLLPVLGACTNEKQDSFFFKSGVN